MNTPSRCIAATIAATLLAAPALAHTGSGAADGFASGFLHPVLGPDHVVAMVAVGLGGVFLGARRSGSCRSSSRSSWRSAAPSA